MDSKLPEVIEIEIDKLIVDDDFNCRGRFSPLEVAGLARDIERQGLISPVVISPTADGKYRLIAGFRRLWAHRVLKRTTIQAVVRPPMSDTEARILNLSENLQRENLNIMQEARAILPLFAKGLTEEEVGKRLGTSRGWSQVRRMLLTLPAEVQAACAAGLFNQGHIRELYTMTLEEQAEAVRNAKDAAARQEKVQVAKKPKDLNEKRPRNRSEIFGMIFHIAKYLGHGLHTRAMAWCAGEISTGEFEASLRSTAENDGRVFPSSVENAPKKSAVG